MKRYILTFLKKNWFKVAVALFLIIVAFQDNLSFNLNLNNPSKTPMTVPIEEKENPKREILSDVADFEVEDKNKVEDKKSQRFNLQPFIPSWRKDKKKQDIEEELEALPSALAKLAEVDAEEINNFIRRFNHVAITEHQKFGIPASIIIANSLLMSTANKSVLAVEHNNIFALPCEDWSGALTHLKGKCYRVYDSAWLSFRDHSVYLKKKANAAEPSLLGAEYKQWVRFLNQAHYSKEEDYGRQIAQLIEDLELYYLDR